MTPYGWEVLILLVMALCLMAGAAYEFASFIGSL